MTSVRLSFSSFTFSWGHLPLKMVKLHTPVFLKRLEPAVLTLESTSPRFGHLSKLKLSMTKYRVVLSLSMGVGTAMGCQHGLCKWSNMKEAKCIVSPLFRVVGYNYPIGLMLILDFWTH